MRKCLELIIRLLGKNDTMTAVGQCFLGRVLTEQGRYEAAEPLLLSAFQKLAGVTDSKFGGQPIEVLIAHYRSRNDEVGVAEYNELLVNRRAVAPK